MRLSEAIALGRMLLSPKVAGKGSTLNCGPNEGCALDMALAALGVESNSWCDAKRHWNWLNKTANNSMNTWAFTVGIKFDMQVLFSKSMTMDEFIDWVRSIEPNEDSPEVDSQIQTPALQAEEIAAT
jgi:hypothetical protein